uniref:Uncharacterized protein n=1 Tax=Picea glauca TaxID=3330 RepID=A0A101M0R1_PICGL|nr:hypothetical protein ABT39_MTgene4216 [Picea glauca]QHR87224.1 hypothetical protein Q903MT_gene1233 [Picea sitchensis]
MVYGGRPPSLESMPGLFHPWAKLLYLRGPCWHLMTMDQLALGNRGRLPLLLLSLFMMLVKLLALDLMLKPP